MSKDFFEGNARTVHEKITGMGTSFKFTVETPIAVFLESGYHRAEEIPIVEKAVVFEAPDIPSSVLDTIRPTLPRGYSVYVFEA
jgi:hypothetical protein